MRSQKYPKQDTNESRANRDLSSEKLKKVFDISMAGLSQEEAQRRLAQYGYNELPGEKKNPLLKFLSYFRDPSLG